MNSEQMYLTTEGVDHKVFDETAGKRAVHVACGGQIKGNETRIQKK
jgi:hypothetical protein